MGRTDEHLAELERFAAILDGDDEKAKLAILEPMRHKLAAAAADPTASEWRRRSMTRRLQRLDARLAELRDR